MAISASRFSYIVGTELDYFWYSCKGTENKMKALEIMVNAKP